MPLTRPTLLNVTAFDATQEQNFTFVVQGVSAQIVANQLTIRNQETNDIVYQEKQETFNYVHTVNANELTNGTYYNATVSVFDVNNNQSPESVPIQFWCYSSPVLSFTNLPDNNIVTNASFNFQFTYTQNENEPLNSYIVNLYNSSQTLLSTSGTQYTTNGSPPFNGNYTFVGFENNSTYYVEVVGSTIEGTVVSTSMQQFNVEYLRPDVFTLLQLTNNCDAGYITIRSNIVLIEGTSNPDPPTYINDEEVDLTEDGSWVEWNEGYSITGDMLTRIWFRNPNPYSQILQFSNTSGQIITLNYMLGYQNINSTSLEAYMELYVTSAFDNDGSSLDYYIFSNYVTPLEDTEYYTVYLTRIKDIYSLQLLVPSTTSTE